MHLISFLDSILGIFGKVLMSSKVHSLGFIVFGMTM
jgi:hypothetical protein